MKCNRCQSLEELKWDKSYHENYNKWRLISLETDRPHDCRIQIYSCTCGTLIHLFKGERDICSICQLERFRN